MITVGMYYEIIEGKEHIFEEKFEVVSNVLEELPGHVQSLLYHQVKKPNSYTIISEWETKDHFTAFIKSDAFKNVTDWGKADVLKDRPRHKVYGGESSL